MAYTKGFHAFGKFMLGISFVFVSGLVAFVPTADAELNVDIDGGHPTPCGPEGKGYCGDFFDGKANCRPGEQMLRKGDPGNTCQQNPKIETVCCMPSANSSTTGGTSAGDCGEGFARQGNVCIPTTTGLSSMTVPDLLMRFFQWLLGLIGMVAILAFLISGFQYLLAFGDEKRIETAKKNMKYAIMGIVIAFSALVVVRTVAMFFGGV
jgi:hypothetical protein